jgi:hypothetical protein
MTSEIEGKMAPAATAANVPNPSNSLSVNVRYVKNLVKGIYLSTSSC